MDRPDDMGASIPWDGYWRSPDRTELTDGLYSVGQFTAKQLLQARAPQTKWEGDFLQAILLQSTPLGPAQSYWLDRLCREFSRQESV